jgi:hypothetical protein
MEWLTEYESRGGIIDYVLIATDDEAINADDRRIAGFGMEIVRQRHRAMGHKFEIRSEPERAVPSDIDAAKFLKEYWYAFSDTPYGLGWGPHYLTEVFDTINQELIGDIGQARILAWSTDWSNYFDAGRDWWGAFLWTVKPASRDCIVWIGASTSD